METSFFEKKSIELADVIVSPSGYMLDYLAARGTSFKETPLRIQNCITPPTVFDGVSKQHTCAYSTRTSAQCVRARLLGDARHYFQTDPSMHSKLQNTTDYIFFDGGKQQHMRTQHELNLRAHVRLTLFFYNCFFYNCFFL